MKKVHPNDDPESYSRISANPYTSFKCNYCGDILPTIEDLQYHNTFFHSHLPLNFTNLADKKNPLVSYSQSSSFSDSSPSTSKITNTFTTLKMPKNTARKSFATSVKRPYAVKSTGSKRLKLDEPDSDSEMDNFNLPSLEEFSFYSVSQPKLDLQEIYTDANFLGGSPVRLSVAQMAAMKNIKPKVLVNDIHRCK